MAASATVRLPEVPDEADILTDTTVYGLAGRRPVLHTEGVQTQSFLGRQALAGLTAAAEASFPATATGAPDWQEARVVERSLLWLGDLPGQQRLLITLLYLGVELGSVLLLPGFRRFSRHSLEARVRAMQGWRKSRFYPIRLLGDGLKAALTMIYMSDAGVLRHIGYFAVCEHPEDDLQVTVRPEALRAAAAKASLAAGATHHDAAPGAVAMRQP